MKSLLGSLKLLSLEDLVGASTTASVANRGPGSIPVLGSGLGTPSSWQCINGTLVALEVIGGGRTIRVNKVRHHPELVHYFTVGNGRSDEQHGVNHDDSY